MILPSFITNKTCSVAVISVGDRRGGDDVGEFAFFEHADFLSEAEQVGVGVSARSLPGIL